MKCNDLFSRGFACFPIAANSKVPLCSHGCKDATTDATAFNQMTAGHSEYNVGVEASRSGLVIVDIDNKGERNGYGYFEGRMPLTLSAETPSGGRHLYFRAPEGTAIPNSKDRLAAGVEVKANNQYVVAPPSSIDGKPYRWIVDAPIADLPEWLLADIRKLAEADEQRKAKAQGIKEPSPSPIPLNNQMRAEPSGADNLKRARAYIARIPPAVEGQGGDEHTYKTAGHLFGFGLSYDEVYTLMSDWNLSCSPPWDDAELRQKISNAERYGSIPQKVDRPPPARPTEPTSFFNDGGSSGGDDDAESYAANDIGVARLWIAAKGDDWLFATQWGRWLKWGGKRWEDASIEELERCVQRWLRGGFLRWVGKIQNDDERARWMKVAARMQTYRGICSVIAIAKGELSIDVEDINAKPNLLNLANGTFDLDAMILFPHDRGDYLTTIARASYRPDATAPTFQSFLKAVQPDPDVRDYLQRSLGYSLTASVTEEKLFILHGCGRNGKTTFINAVKYALGDYASTGNQYLLTYRSSAFRGDNTPDVAALFGQRFVSISETSEADKLDEGKVKSIVSTAKITATRKYEHPFEFVPTHKLWLDTNHLPTVRGTDEGVWRRLVAIPWSVTIPTDAVDYRLGAKLEAEADGILLWALEGLRRYREVGLDNKPTAVNIASDEYRNDSDTLSLFLRDETTPGGMVSKTLLYARYVSYCDEAKVPAVNRVVFNRRLEAKGYKECRTAKDRLWKGLSLVATGGNAPQPTSAEEKPF